jgi:hypothetical protein
MAVLAIAVVVVLTVGAGSSEADSRSQFCRPARSTVFPLARGELHSHLLDLVEETGRRAGDRRESGHRSGCP